MADILMTDITADFLKALIPHEACHLIISLAHPLLLPERLQMTSVTSVASESAARAWNGRFWSTSVLHGHRRREERTPRKPSCSSWPRS